MGVLNQDHRTRHQDVSRSLVIGTGEAPGTVGAGFIAGKTGRRIFIQRIAVHVMTAAAQAIDFEDDTGTHYATLPASAAVGVEHVLLDHPEGVPLPLGEALNLAGAAGVGCRIDVTAYRRITGVMSAATFASS